MKENKNLFEIKTINFANSHSFVFKEYSTLLRLNSLTNYNIENKSIKIFKNFKIFSNLNKKKNIENKFSFNNYKRRIENSVYTSYFSRYSKYLQKNFVRISLKNNENPLRLFIGNYYIDNLFLLKSKICIGTKPKINLNYRINLEDKYNSKINIKTRNLNSIAVNYKGKINNFSYINFCSKFSFSKAFNNNVEFSYDYSKNLKVNLKTGIDYNFNIEKKVKNFLSLGFNFSGFEFSLPINLSNFDNTITLMELLTYNILVNIAGYFTHFFYQRVFDDKDE